MVDCRADRVRGAGHRSAARTRNAAGAFALIRRHIITGDPILYAPERASRPHAFSNDDSDTGRCPFCAGHEADTPPEITRRGDPWRIRVFPNKFPAVDGHEVIVESPRHDVRFEDIEDVASIIEIYAERYRAHRDAQFIALFKNDGARAGASLEHVHSQIMPLTFEPPVIARHSAAFASAKSCPLCVAPAGELLISENSSFRRFAPFGAAHPWEQWIVPKRHRSDLSGLSADECAQLGAVLQDAARSAHSAGASYNFLWYAFPHQPAAHFYVSVIARVTEIAGFEMTTGTFIDIIDPAATARRFR